MIPYESYIRRGVKTRIMYFPLSLRAFYAAFSDQLHEGLQPS